MIDLSPYEVQNMIANALFVIILGGGTACKLVYEVLHWGQRD